MNCRTSSCGTLVNPSNINNGYPSGQFTSMTPAMSYNSGTYNFDKSYQPNAPIIERIDYRNNNELLHNNLQENVLSERIVEYKIMIDSRDRNVDAFPNPFKYAVTFNPATRRLISQEVYTDPKKPCLGTKIVDESIGIAPSPYINQEFKNVKYIKIDSVVLPQCAKINDDGNDFDSVCDYTLPTDRFINMRIKELDSDQFFSTNNVVTNASFLLYPDKLLGTKYYVCSPYYNSRIYPNSKLGNISKLSIEFLDSFGNTLNYYLKPARCDKKAKNLFNPLDRRIQNSMVLIIGVVECELTTIAKFGDN